MKWILFLIILMLSVQGNDRMQVHMGTVISVRVENIDASDAVFGLFQDLDNRLSTYKEDSEISRLNREQILLPSEPTRLILERSIEMARITGGAFDVTIGALSHGAYRFGRDERLPDQQEITEAKGNIGIDRLRIDKERATLEKGSIVDLGGIAKGFAVDLSIELLLKRGIDKAVVAASGDIGCIGPCQIEINDPFHPEGSIAVLRSSLPRLAVSTSGNYERYIRTKQHNHLLDPSTGLSGQVFASVTLLGDGDNTRLDAIATAVSVMEMDRAVALLERERIAYLLILNDGTILRSEMPYGIVFSRAN